MSMNSWQTIEEATIVEPTKARLSIPTFDVQDLVWSGASYVVRQYNYSSSKKFVLTNRPVKPVTANFVPCIKYRVGDVVYRYKLWEDEGLIADIPLYEGELIRKNFCIEIWSLEDETTALNLRTRYLTTNRHVDRVNIRDYTTLYSLAEAALAVIDADLEQDLPDLDNLTFHYRGEDLTGTGGWPSNLVGGPSLVNDAGDIANTEYTNNTATFYAGDVSSTNVKTKTTGETFTVSDMFFVIRVPSGADPQDIVKFGTAPFGTFNLNYNAVGGFIVDWSDVLGLTVSGVAVNTWYLVHCSTRISPDDVSLFRYSVDLYTPDGTLLSSDFGDTATFIPIVQGDLQLLCDDGFISFADVVGYGADQTDITAHLAYFKQRYYDGVPQLPFVFDGAAWLDNSDDDEDTEEDLTVLAATSNNYALDYFYLKDPNTGLYYKVNITDVDGTKSFQVAQTPTTL